MTRFLLLLCVVPASWSVLAAAPAGAQLLSTTDEFQANATAALNQGYPAVARTGPGAFVVVWETENDPVTGDDVFIRAFDATGAPIGPQTRMNTTTAAAQDTSDVAADFSGNVAAVWESIGQDGDSVAVVGRMFNASGTPTSNEFQVNVTTQLAQDEPTITTGAPGQFVVAWESSGQDGFQSGVFGRRFNTAGAPIGGEFAVNTYTTFAQLRPAIASDNAGNFVVVWHSVNQDGSGAGVFGQRFSANGARRGTEFQVNSYTTGPQDEADVAVDGLGNIIVVWESGSATLPQDGSAAGVYGQRFASNGVPLGTEFRVNSYTILNQDDVAVAADGLGNFVVSWESVNQDGSDPGIFVQRYDVTGVRVGTEFRVNRTTQNSQEDPAVVMDGQGSSLIAWQSDLQDGDQGGIYFRSVCDGTGGNPAQGFVCDEPLCNLDGTPCLDGMCCDGTCTRQPSCFVTPGDCNVNGVLDAGDPICTVLCLIGTAPPTADCSLGADCNCTFGLDAGDPICVVLRLIGTLENDNCVPTP